VKRESLVWAILTLHVFKAARASVASTVSELVDVLPKIATCHTAGLLASNATKAGNLHFATSASSSRIHAHVSDVDSKNGVPTASVMALLKEARNVVIAARSALY